MICAASGHDTSCFWQRLKSAALRGPRNLGRKKLQRARCIRGGVGAFYRPRFSEIRCKLSTAIAKVQRPTPRLVWQEPVPQEHEVVLRKPYSTCPQKKQHS